MVSLIVGEGAGRVRREVGATSWAALEDLVARPSTGTAACVVVASVRDVAESLGLSKNTVHRALRRLVDAGLVSPIQHRSDDGRFVTGTYRLSVDPEVLRPNHDAHAPTSTTPTPMSRRQRTNRRTHTDDTTQLSLLTP